MRKRAVESWLREEVGSVYDELREDPSRVVTAAEVRSGLAQRHEMRIRRGSD